MIKLIEYLEISKLRFEIYLNLPFQIHFQYIFVEMHISTKMRIFVKEILWFELKKKKNFENCLSTIFLLQLFQNNSENEFQKF